LLLCRSMPIPMLRPPLQTAAAAGSSRDKPESAARTRAVEAAQAQHHPCSHFHGRRSPSASLEGLQRHVRHSHGGCDSPARVARAHAGGRRAPVEANRRRVRQVCIGWYRGERADPLALRPLRMHSLRRSVRGDEAIEPREDGAGAHPILRGARGSRPAKRARRRSRHGRARG